MSSHSADNLLEVLSTWSIIEDDAFVDQRTLQLSFLSVAEAIVQRKPMYL